MSTLDARPASGVSACASLVAAAIAAALLGACQSPPSYQVTVEAGEYDRAGTIVTFEAPADLRPSPGSATRSSDGRTSWQLERPDGRILPLQIGRDGTARFVPEDLPAGASVTYALSRGSGGSTGTEEGVAVAPLPEEIAVRVGGDPLTRYRVEPELPRTDMDTLYRRAGYLHPVRSPSGTLVTDDYPPDHAHHHGLWAAWTNTEYRGETPDFWNTPEGTGTVRVEAIDSTWSGPVAGGLRAIHRYVDRTGERPATVLRERWTTRVFRVRGGTEGTPYRLFEVDLHQVNVTADPLVLPEYHYGGFAVRGHRSWNDTSRVQFLTSAGRDRSDGNETRARWTHIGGTVEGSEVGLAVLSHPENFRSPQPVRIHPTMPYFCYAPSQAGEWQIGPDETYEARYRIVTYDGTPDPALLDRLWNAWAHPPEVTIEAR